MPRKISDKKLPPRGAAERIQVWAAGGSPVRAIARGLGVSLDTLNAWLAKYPKLRSAMDAGRDEEHELLRNALIRNIDKWPAAAIFLLKARHGYRDGDTAEAANKVSIVFQLPGATPLEKYSGRIIEHTKAIEHDDD